MNTQIRYASKNPICRRAVFVDGVARTGKFLACRIVSHLVHGEHAQYQAAIEHMCYMFFIGAVDRQVAAPFLQFITEEQTYNRMVGRYLNTRLDDASSIYQSPHHESYMARTVAPSGTDAADAFNKAGFIPVYPLHNAMVSGTLIFDAMPWAQVIHICRHPVVQTYKWFERGWGHRDLEDPLSFVPLVETDAGTVPWFAYKWSERFLSGNAMERALDSVLMLQAADETGFAELSDQQNANVLRFTLERLMAKPTDIVQEISAFLGSPVHKKMASMLVDEALPITPRPDRHKSMLDEISRLVSADRLNELLLASRAFEEKWDVDPI